MMMKTDLVVIGGGSAGLSAAIEARKNGVEDIVVLERSASTTASGFINIRRT